MAKEKLVVNRYRLPSETKARMTQAQDDIAKAEHMAAVLKEVGMDTTELEEKLSWVKKTRAILLREFG